MKERKKVDLDMGVSTDYMIVLGLGRRAAEMTWTEAMNLSRILDFMAVAAAMGVGASDEVIEKARDHASDVATEAAMNLMQAYIERERMSTRAKDYEDVALPYPEPDGETRTGGWSGSDLASSIDEAAQPDGTSGKASHERALREADDGTLTKRLREVHGLLARRRELGATWREAGVLLNLHHGQASGALSNLHRQGAIVRLKGDRRDRCAVYVLPEWAQGREEAPYGRRKPEGQVTLGKDALAALLAVSEEEGYEQGKRYGRSHRDGEVLEFVTHLRQTVLAGKPIQTHTKTCFTKHPECALLAVQKYLKAGLG